MSEGKASRYRVVSAEELRRRALAAARDRLDRVNAALIELSASVAAADATYGGVQVVVPATQSISSTHPVLVDSQAVAAERALEQARSNANQAIAAARARQIEDVYARFLSMPAELDLGQVNRGETVGLAEPKDSVLEAAVRVAQRLPGDAAPDAVARCETLVSEIESSDSVDRKQSLLTALRSTVQAEYERSRLIAENRVRIDRLYQELDGLSGAEVSSVRGFLRGVALDSPLPNTLAERVSRSRVAAQQELDRAFALRVTRETLEEQGHNLGEDFLTVVATESGALVPLAGSGRHGVRIRERAGQLLFNVVRFERTPEGAEDVAAAEEFCESFASIVRRTGERGVELTELLHFEPGSGKVEVRDAAAPWAPGVPARTKPTVVERRRQR